MKELIGEEDTTRFVEFTKNIQEKSIEESTVFDMKTEFPDKMKRTEVH